MRSRELLDALSQIQTLISSFAFKTVANNDKAEMLTNTESLRLGVKLAHGIPPLETYSTAIEQINLFKEAKDNVVYPITTTKDLKTQVRSLIGQIRQLRQLLNSLVVPLAENSLQIRVPDVEYLEDLKVFIDSLGPLIVYPAQGAKLDPPKLVGTESGSIWVSLAFLQNPAFLLTVGCLGVFFFLMKHVFRYSYLFSELAQYRELSALGTDHLREVLNKLKSEDARIRLEKLIKEHASHLGESDRNEMINRLLEISYPTFEQQIQAGMKILYHSRELAQDIRKELPDEFSMKALTEAVATQKLKALTSTSTKPDSDSTKQEPDMQELDKQQTRHE